MNTIENCKTIIEDNLIDFDTVINLLSKPSPDLDNIKYIISKGRNEINNFINNFNTDPELKITSNTIKFYNISDIKSYDDILDILGDEAETSNNEIGNSYLKLVNITKVLNEGWQPDWNNPNEKKYYPWFYMDKADFRLTDVSFLDSFSVVSGRLCFSSRELGQLSVDLFLDIYKDYYEYK